MEVVTFAKDVVQSLAEQAASCRPGQAALRHLDRALWVVEKCARWAVPPPMDQDERTQPELVRPLPWVFFLTMLVALRVTRESMSLVNLVLGKPPLRSADVVMYIQSKRRYLRTLKYQGSRNLRARSAPTSEPWYSSLQALFAFTMCFRRSQYYGNNNTTRISNNDEALVIKRSKRGREAAPVGTTASPIECTMERLIEKMMVQLDADSDDDSSFTLTNATSLISDRSEDSDPEENTLEDHNTTITSNNSFDTTNSSDFANEKNESPMPLKQDEVASSTPEATEMNNKEDPKEADKKDKTEDFQLKNGTEKENVITSKAALSKPNHVQAEKSPEKDTFKTESSAKINEQKQTKYSPKETTKSFLQSERCSPQKQQSKQSKFGTKIANAFSKTFSKKHANAEALANGRAMSVPNKKKGFDQRRNSDTPLVRITPAEESLK